MSEYTFHLVRYLASNPAIERVTVLSDITDGRCFTDGKVDVIQCWKLNDSKTPFRVLKQVRKLKPDIVHFNLIFRQFGLNRLTNFLGLCTPALCKFFGNQVVITLHSIAEAVDLEQIGYSTSVLNKLGYRIATKLLLRSDKVTVTHRYFVEILRDKYHANNVINVPHGVFNAPIENLAFRGKRFLFFGKIGPYKNLELTLEAFREVYNRDSEAELLIAGGSHPMHPNFLESVLEKYSDIPNVKTTGYVEENELQSIFCSCIAVILPYTISTWSSGVFTLACEYGRPVIASDLEDFRDLKDEGAGLILFPNGNKDALVASMLSIVQDESLQKKMGDLNTKWAMKNGFSNVSNRIVEVFNETLIENASSKKGR